jgi:hypothetical protein
MAAQELIIYSECGKGKIEREYLETHAVKSTPRNYFLALWLAGFEVPKDLRFA